MIDAARRLEREVRQRPLDFAHGLGFKPDRWQAKMLQSQSKRLILNCARQTGKSSVAAVRALRNVIANPGWLELLLSPSLRQSSELFRKVSVLCKLLPDPPQLEEDNRLSLQFANGSRIVSLPSSESTIRGFSAVNEILVDEAAFVSDGIYRSVRPMLATSGGTLVLMSTPYGRRGFFYEAWIGSDAWERYEVKAENCKRIAPEFLAQERLALGPFYAQEYDCAFIDTQDSVFDSALVQAALSEEVAPL